MSYPLFVKENKAYNRYYMLPLLLGIIGILGQLYGSRRNRQNFWIVLLFFFMTGFTIVLYLNQPPYQVRERDYAYTGSFYLCYLDRLCHSCTLQSYSKARWSQLRRPLTALGVWAVTFPGRGIGTPGRELR